MNADKLTSLGLSTINDERGKLVKIRGKYLPSDGDVAGCAACGALMGSRLQFGGKHLWRGTDKAEARSGVPWNRT